MSQTFVIMWTKILQNSIAVRWAVHKRTRDRRTDRQADLVMSAEIVDFLIEVLPNTESIFVFRRRRRRIWRSPIPATTFRSPLLDCFCNSDLGFFSYSHYRLCRTQMNLKISFFVINPYTSGHSITARRSFISIIAIRVHPVPPISLQLYTNIKPWQMRCDALDKKDVPRKKKQKRMSVQNVDCCSIPWINLEVPKVFASELLISIPVPVRTHAVANLPVRCLHVSDERAFRPSFPSVFRFPAYIFLDFFLLGSKKLTCEKSVHIC